MKNLLIICVILALVNSFIGAGYNYDICASDNYGNRTLQNRALLNPVLPIDSFVIPVQGTVAIVHHLIKTSIPFPVFYNSHYSLTSWFVPTVFHIHAKEDSFSSNLNLIEVVVLRI
jgi:hypothetical protein